MARIRGIADGRIVAALSAEQRYKDKVGRYATYLSSHQVGSISKVRLNENHVQVKLFLISDSDSEFPQDPNVWLSIHQLDDELQLRVRDHLRFTGASEIIDKLDEEVQDAFS